MTKKHARVHDRRGALDLKTAPSPSKDGELVPLQLHALAHQQVGAKDLGGTALELKRVVCGVYCTRVPVYPRTVIDTTVLLSTSRRSSWFCLTMCACVG